MLSRVTSATSSGVVFTWHRRHDKGSSSTPMLLRSSNWASMSVVPLPAIGSKMVSPGWLHRSISQATRGGGHLAANGWSPCVTSFVAWVRKSRSGSPEATSPRCNESFADASEATSAKAALPIYLWCESSNGWNAAARKNPTPRRRAASAGDMVGAGPGNLNALLSAWLLSPYGRLPAHVLCVTTLLRIAYARYRRLRSPCRPAQLASSIVDSDHPGKPEECSGNNGCGKWLPLSDGKSAAKSARLCQSPARVHERSSGRQR